jgi:hypothetical protein
VNFLWLNFVLFVGCGLENFIPILVCFWSIFMEIYWFVRRFWWKCFINSWTWNRYVESFIEYPWAQISAEKYSQFLFKSSLIPKTNPQTFPTKLPQNPWSTNHKIRRNKQTPQQPNKIKKTRKRCSNSTSKKKKSLFKFPSIELFVQLNKQS